MIDVALGQTIDFVADCYRYRGIEISKSVNRRLRRYKNKGLFQKIDEQLLPQTKTVILMNSGWGEIALYEALQKNDILFIAVEKEPDKTCVARHVAEGRATNIIFLETYLNETPQTKSQEIQTIILE